MKCKKKVLSALVALGLAFGGATVSLPPAEAASVDTISKISVKADGSNFKYWNQDSASFKALKAYRNCGSWRFDYALRGGEILTPTGGKK